MKAKLFIGTVMFLLSFHTSYSQCPPNIDFELGNFDNWQCFVGKTYDSLGLNVISLNPCQPQADRHQIIFSKTDKDPYGNFPTLCPFGGNYSVKLGNENTGSEAEGVSYTFTVPTTVDTFTFTYFYAVVFADPGHKEFQQPRFFVSAYEVATGKIINCAAFNYVATSSLPGFYKSKINDKILYKNWTPVSLQFAGLMGKQVRLEFKNADCTLGGHFGYAYLDVSSGCTNILATAPYCIQTNSLTLNAPYGFQYYKWYDSTYNKVLGTLQTLTLSPPPTNLGSFYVDAIPYPGFGCRDTFEAKVKPLSIPSTPNNSNEFYFCKNQLNATIDVTADSGNVIVWYVSDSNSVGSEYPPIIQTNIIGDYIYYISQKQLFGCEGYKKKIVVHIIGFSNSTITVNNVLQCLNSNNFIFSSTASTSNNITYSWYFDYYDSLITNSDTPVAHHFNNAGSYSVLLKANYLNLCTSFQNIGVTVIPAPLADFAYTNPICEKQTVINFTNNSYSPDWSSKISDWWWNINGNITTSKTPIPFIANSDTPIVVKFLVTTKEGCASDTVIKVLTIQHIPKASFFVSPPLLCSTEILNFADNSSINNIVNGEQVSVWNWTINNINNFYSKDVNTSFDTGFNKISLNVESSFGCKSSIYDSLIYVHQKPVLQLSLNDSCVNKSINYIVRDTLNIVKDWYWNLSGGYYQASNTFSKIYTEVGDYPFSVIGKTSKGCSDTILRSFHIYDNVAFAGKDTIVAFNEPVYLNAHGYANEKYFWNPGRGLSSDTIENPIALYNHDITYNLHSVTKEGCIKDSKIFIKRYEGPALYVATAFTPNGDNKNDVLHVFPVGIKQFYHFSIYNRKGNLIFITNDYLKGWDGTFNGQKLGNETFVVVAEAMDYKGQPLMYKGTVVLIR